MHKHHRVKLVVLIIIFLLNLINICAQEIQLTFSEKKSEKQLHVKQNYTHTEFSSGMKFICKQKPKNNWQVGANANVNKNFKAGTKFSLSFWAKSDTPEARLWLYYGMSGTKYIKSTVKLVKEWKKYSYDFTIDTSGTGKVGFFYGSQKQEIHLAKPILKLLAKSSLGLKTSIPVSINKKFRFKKYPKNQEITGASIDESKVTRIIYVDSKARSGGTGSKQKPFISYNKAIKLAVKQIHRGKGTKVIISPGIYRESCVIRPDSKNQNINSVPLVIEGSGQGKTIFCGSKIWSR